MCATLKEEQERSPERGGRRFHPPLKNQPTLALCTEARPYSDVSQRAVLGRGRGASFRRQFNTALAAIGLNVQQAMALAGHKSTTTHMAYVQLAQHGALETPSAAMPKLVAAAPLPFALPPRSKTARKPARPSRRV